MRVRKNVKFLSAGEKSNFVKAVLALKTKPSVLHPGDPNLNRYDDYPEIHMNAMMANPGWAHQRPAFFPWHRALLLEFENDLAAVDPSVTIPYWDWPDAASSPFAPDLLGGDGDQADDGKVKTGPFARDGAAHWTLKVNDSASDPDYLRRSFGTDATAPALPSANDVATALSTGSYDSYPWRGFSSGLRGQVETALHNLVHRYVGGTMGAMTSPNDPVFWLHHCNIDRLWADWQRSFPAVAPYLPATGAALGHNLMDAMIFSAAPPPPWQGAFTPASVVNHHTLGYMYDDELVVPALRANLTFLRILFGVVNDAPGVVIGPDGKPHPVPGGPGDPWAKLSPAERDELVGLAIHQAAGLISNRGLSQSIQAHAGTLISKATQNLFRQAM